MLFLVCTFIFLAYFLVGHYRLSQILQATNGQLFFYDIWPDSPVCARPALIRIGNYVSWWEFLHSEQCKKG